MTQANEKKLEELFKDNFRKKGEPINIEKLTEIAEELNELEAKNKAEN